MGLCFALIEHLMKFYLYIYINIKYIYVSVWAGTLEVFSSSCNSNHCCYLITGLPQGLSTPPALATSVGGGKCPLPLAWGEHRHARACC